jgi:hypothetical protein
MEDVHQHERLQEQNDITLKVTKAEWYLKGRNPTNMKGY